jgi:hypothetical protein
MTKRSHDQPRAARCQPAADQRAAEAKRARRHCSLLSITAGVTSAVDENVASPSAGFECAIRM